MAGFLFRLETADGAPADPPTMSAAVPNWRAGDTIPLGGRTLRVVRVRDDDAEQPPVLVVVEEEDGVRSAGCGTTLRSTSPSLRRRACTRVSSDREISRLSDLRGGGTVTAAWSSNPHD